MLFVNVSHYSYILCFVIFINCYISLLLTVYTTGQKIINRFKSFSFQNITFQKQRNQTEKEKIRVVNNWKKYKLCTKINTQLQDEGTKFLLMRTTVTQIRAAASLVIRSGDWVFSLIKVVSPARQ